MLLVVCAYVSLNTTAQGTSSYGDSLINQQIWIDLYPHYYVNEKLEYYGDAGYRAILNGDLWTRLYVRPSVKVHLNPTWEFHSGLGLFYLFNKYDSDRFEVTPWQGVQANWPRGNRISLKHQIKVEERFSFRTNDWSSSFDLRFRIKISGKLKLFKALAKNWYIPFYAEIFIPVKNNIDEVFRDKGRAGIGIGYNYSEVWRIAMLMNWQSSRTGIDEDLHVTDYAYQLKVMKRWRRRVNK